MRIDTRVSSEKKNCFAKKKIRDHFASFSHFVRSRIEKIFAFFREISLQSVSRKNKVKIQEKINAKISRKNGNYAKKKVSRKIQNF